MATCRQYVYVAYLLTSLVGSTFEWAELGRTFYQVGGAQLVNWFECWMRVSQLEELQERMKLGVDVVTKCLHSR